MKKLACIALAAAFLVVSTPAEEVQAQVAFGPQAVLWDLDRPGIGARVNFGLADSFGIEDGFFQDLKGSVNGSYVFGESESFPGGSVSWNAILINVNAIVPFEVEAAITPYAGAGINHTRFSSSGSSNGFTFGGYGGSASGLNLLGGIEFGLGDIPAFAELQYATSGAGALHINFGVLFGG